MAHVRKNHYKPAPKDEKLHTLIQAFLPPPPKDDPARPRYRGRRNTRAAPPAPRGAVPVLDNARVLSGAGTPRRQPAGPGGRPLPDPQRNFEAYLARSIAPRRAAEPARGSRAPLGAPRAPAKHSPYAALQAHAAALTEFEQTEILQFPQVYYCGERCAKRYNPRGPNGGYDDAAGDYQGQTRDHVAYRYELLELLGEGSFGRVFKALDHASGRVVALKIVKNKKRFHRQGLVEVRLLETIRKNDPDDISNCLKIAQSFYFRAHLCIVCEMYSVNLYELLVQHGLRGLRVDAVCSVAVQMVNALCYLYNLNIIHADIKPENILLVREGEMRIKLIDVGSGCLRGQTIYTYIQSRYYRAPEVILGLPYGPEIDVWSTGCVLCELLTGGPVFPGRDEADQLGKICEYLGLPPAPMRTSSPRQAEFFINGRLRSAHRPASTTLAHTLRTAPPDLLEMVERMLVWDPAARWTPHQLAQSAFFRRHCGGAALVGDLGRGAVGTGAGAAGKWAQEGGAVEATPEAPAAGAEGPKTEAESAFARGAGEMGFVRSEG